MLKSKELEKQKLVYIRDFLGVQRDNNERVFNWKSQNGSLSPEEVQHLVKTISISIFIALDGVKVTTYVQFTLADSRFPGELKISFSKSR